MFDLPVPKGWKLVKLSDLGEVNRGRSRHRPRDAAHLYGGPYPFVQTGDVKASQGRITKFTQTYSEAGLGQSRLWPKDTMCITIAANIAETGILQFPACFPDSVIGFIHNEKQCNVYFVEYVFRLLRKRIQAQATGSVQDNINLQTLERLHFPLPELKEQNQLAAILCSLDDKIQLNHQINQTFEQMAQAIFKSWFVDFEPVKAKIAALEAGGSEDDALLAAMKTIAGNSLFATDAAEADAETQLARLQAEHPKQYATLRVTAELFPSAMQESELGEIPEGWEKTGFANWVAIKRGKSITRAKVVPGNVPVVAGGLEPAYFHNEYNVAGPAITISASGANAGYVNLYHQNIWSSDSSYVGKQSTPYFYTSYICLKFYQKEIFDMQTGAAQPHVYPKDLERLKVVIGCDKLLRQSEHFLSDLFEKSAALKNEEITLTQLRDTLLPKLLSGELSIPDAIVETSKTEAAAYV